MHLLNQAHGCAIAACPVAQADAAVIYSSLSRQHAGPAVNRPWLLPSALDVVELSLNSSAAYTAAPSLWLALAGCGHAVVSASFIAAAAQLVPLSSAAAGAARRLQAAWPAAQQQLEASLQAPDPETVDLLSTSHAVLALEAAAWLHQQFTRAAGGPCCVCSWARRAWLARVAEEVVVGSGTAWLRRACQAASCP
jgi:hypothetical protein